MATKVKFNTTILQQGNNTGIRVPEDAVEKLASGKRPAVKVTLNSTAIALYRSNAVFPDVFAMLVFLPWSPIP